MCHEKRGLARSFEHLRPLVIRCGKRDPTFREQPPVADRPRFARDGARETAPRQCCELLDVEQRDATLASRRDNRLREGMLAAALNGRYCLEQRVFGDAINTTTRLYGG